MRALHMPKSSFNETPAEQHGPSRLMTKSVLSNQPRTSFALSDNDEALKKLIEKKEKQKQKMRMSQAARSEDRRE